MIPKPFAYCFLVICLLACGMFAGDAAAKDGDIPPADTDRGWREEHFYIANLGSSSKRKERLEALEAKINDSIQKVPGIECVKLNPIFGKGTDLMLILRYKIGENKDKKPCSIKLFYLPDISSTIPRDEDMKYRTEWYTTHLDINLTSDGDWYYNGAALTIMIYESIK